MTFCSFRVSVSFVLRVLAGCCFFHIFFFIHSKISIYMFWSNPFNRLNEQLTTAANCMLLLKMLITLRWERNSHNDRHTVWAELCNRHRQCTEHTLSHHSIFIFRHNGNEQEIGTCFECKSTRREQQVYRQRARVKFSSKAHKTHNHTSIIVYI